MYFVLSALFNVTSRYSANIVRVSVFGVPVTSAPSMLLWDWPGHSHFSSCYALGIGEDSSHFGSWYPWAVGLGTWDWPGLWSFQLLVPFELARTQSFRLLVPLGLTGEDSAISGLGTLGTEEDSVISARGNLGIGEDSATSALGGLGTLRTGFSHMTGAGEYWASRIGTGTLVLTIPTIYLVVLQRYHCFYILV